MSKDFIKEILDIAEQVFSFRPFVRVIYFLLIIVFLILIVTLIVLFVNAVIELFRLFKYWDVKDDEDQQILSSYIPLVFMNVLSSFIMIIASYRLIAYSVAGFKDPVNIGLNGATLLQNSFYDKGTLFTLIITLFIINAFQVDIVDIQDRLMPFVNYMFLNDIQAASDLDPYEIRYGGHVKSLKILPEKEIDQRFMIKNLSFFLLGVLFLIFASEDIVLLIRENIIDHDFVSTAYILFFIYMFNQLMDFSELNQFASSSQMNMEVMIKHQLSPSYSGPELQEKMDTYCEEMREIEDHMLNEMFHAVDSFFYEAEDKDDKNKDEKEDENKDETDDKEDEE